MLGRLPTRYQRAIWVTGLLLFAALGAWAVTAAGLPTEWTRGALAGAALGVLAVLLFLRELHPEPVRVRVRR